MMEAIKGAGSKASETRPVAPLGIIAMPGCEKLGERINQYLKNWRDGIGEQNAEL